MPRCKKRWQCLATKNRTKSKDCPRLMLHAWRLQYPQWLTPLHSRAQFFRSAAYFHNVCILLRNVFVTWFCFCNPRVTPFFEVERHLRRQRMQVRKKTHRACHKRCHKEIDEAMLRPGSVDFLTIVQ